MRSLSFGLHHPLDQPAFIPRMIFSGLPSIFARSSYMHITPFPPKLLFRMEPPLSRPKLSRLDPLQGQTPFTHRSLQGRGAMPPAAWHQAGSTLLAAPTLQRRPLPPSPRGAMPAEYVEHAERLRAAEDAEARRKATLAATTLSTPRLQEARREELAQLSAAMAPPQGSPRGVQPRSRAKVTLTAGLLSGAGTCHALMVGNMTAAAFAESASAMPQATQVTWLLSFGSCIARLGATLVDLRGQVRRLTNSSARANLQSLANNVIDRIEGVEAAMEGLREGTISSLAEGEKVHLSFHITWTWGVERGGVEHCTPDAAAS